MDDKPSSLSKPESPAFVGISDVAKRTTNPLRKIVDRMQCLANPEKSFITLALGDPSRYFAAHPSTIAAVETQLRSLNSNGYPPSNGYRHARRALAQKYGDGDLAEDDVIIASGCSGALELAISVLVGAGEGLLVPEPGFTLYSVICHSRAIRVHPYRLDHERSWEIDLKHVEEIVQRSNARTWLINNPSNPCGSVYGAGHLAACKQLAVRLGLVLIADEVYEDLVFPPSQYIPLRRVQPFCPMLTCSGIAKRYLVPGWRLGWILVTGGREMDQVREGLAGLTGLILGANSLVQAALPDILQMPDLAVKSLVLQLRQRADILYTRLSTVPGLKPIQPQGALYMLVRLENYSMSDEEFAQRLLQEEAVMILPGAIFGLKGFFRVVFCADETVLEEACDRIESFCKRYYQK